MVEALASSPDPLNHSPNLQPPPKTRHSSGVRHSLPPRGSSPTKQTFELDIGNQISPQKIRVTVEARKSDLQSVASPTRPQQQVNRRKERTTTTTVPVKGLSDSEDEIQEVTTPKRGRGRPRKSTETPVAARQRGRAATPSRKNSGRRKSIGDLVDGEDEEDYDFQIGKGVEVCRGKGRGRSGSNKRAAGKSTPAATQSAPMDAFLSSTTNEKERGRKKKSLANEFVVLEDESSGGNADPENAAQAEMTRALQAIDANAIDPPSAYSTIRSTTTDVCNVRDILIARFDPGNETPRRTGWSSPRTVDARRHSSPIRNLNNYSPPSVSPEGIASRYEEESVAVDPVFPESSNYASEGQSAPREYSYEEEDTNGMGQVREFDTTLDSEGFSMISVDTVPSLREHLGSPAYQGQHQEPAKPIKNKNLVSVQAVEAATRDDSFSTAPADIIEAATQARKAKNPNILSIQNAPIEDSFSSIAPEVFEAATPTWKTQSSKLLALKHSCAEDSFSSVAPEILEAATPGRDLSKPKTLQPRAIQAYEDSFSAIPSTIFEAATPAPIRQASQKLCSSAQADTAYDRLGVPGPSRPPGLSQQGVTSSMTTRLPTPEETPSPATEALSLQESGSDKTSSLVSAAVNSELSFGDDTSINHQMRSSPPAVAPRRYTYTAHFRQKRELYPGMAQTPSIIFSSPSLPPAIHHTRVQPVPDAKPEPSQRPTLSPIVRAGRVLQGIVVPSSAPRDRAHSLGSPFKSPSGDKFSSPSSIHSSLSPAQELRPKPLPRIDLAGNLFTGSAKYAKWNSSVGHDDPFSNNAPQRQISPHPEEKQAYTLGLPENRLPADPHILNIGSEAESMQSDDAMSWQAEEEVPANDDVTTSLINNIKSSTGARGSSLEGSYPSTGTNTDTLEQKWAARRAATSKQISTTEASQVIVIDSGDETPTDAHVEDDEAFGLLLETLNSSSPAVIQHQIHPKDAVEKPRRSKIPSLWRKNSKRFVYIDELSHLSSPPTRAARTEDSANKSTNNDTDTLDLSSWHIPQKSNFKPRVRHSETLDLSALLASSPNKNCLPVLTKSSPSNGSVSQDRSFPSTSRSRVSDDDTRELQPQSYTPLPQKLGFNPNPRVRGVGDVESSSKFASSPINQSDSNFNNVVGVHPNKRNLFQKSAPEASSLDAVQPLSSSSPSRTNTLRLEIQQIPTAQLSESECSYDSNFSVNSHEEQENQAIESRTFKWTETLPLVSAQMRPFPSPTKSCLRSPLKTPTYGSGSGNNTSPSKTVAFLSSSPLPFSLTEPLSSTTWSRQHWLLLDSILQAWKPDKAGESGGGPKSRRRSNTRVISRLLGKSVFSQGEKMKLQQWHLEVVDEFRGHVPGWEEAVIAKRVFALIVGEERRALELIGNGHGYEVDQ